MSKTRKENLINVALFTLMAVTLVGCGSSILGIFGKKKPPAIPTQPDRSDEQKENLRKNIGVIADVSQEIYTSGTNAQSYESKILLDSAKVLQTVSGLPTDPVNFQAKKEVEKLHRDIREREEEYRKDMAEWQRKIAALKDDKLLLERENSLLDKALDEAWWWIWVLGILCVIWPTGGAFLIRRIMKGGAKAVDAAGDVLKGQMKQLVDGIQEYKEEDPEHSKLLLDKLMKKTDTQTRHLINTLKNT